jgi:hypothetical protein
MRYASSFRTSHINPLARIVDESSVAGMSGRTTALGLREVSPMTRRFLVPALVLLCGATGCVYQPHPASSVFTRESDASPEPIRGKYSMAAGDAVGERMFVDNAIARGPVLIETASIAGE